MLDLTTVSKVKRFIGLRDEDDKDDQLLSELVTQVSTHIESYLDRTLEIQTDKVEFFDVEYRSVAFKVSAFPISAVAGVWNDTDRTFDSSSVVDSSNYYVETATGLVVIDKQFLLPGPGVLKIQYTGGIATTVYDVIKNFPAISSAATMECAYRYRNRSNLGLIAATAAGGGITLQQKDEFLPQVSGMLDPYRRVY